MDDDDKTKAQLIQELETLRRRLVELETLNAHLFETVQSARAEAEEEAHRLSIVNEMSRQLSLAQTEQAIFDITAHFTLQIVSGQRSSIALIMPDSDQVEIIALNGVAGGASIGVSFPWRESDLAEAITEKRLTYHPHRVDPNLSDISSGLNAPLIASGQVIGTLNVGRKEPNAFTQRDQNLLGQIASLVAAHVESRRFFSQTQAALAETEELAE